MNALIDFSLDKKRFLIQILVAVGISVFFQLIIDPLIYNPLVRSNMKGFIEPARAIVITSMSQWFFSFSLAFLIYPDNEKINSYLLCAFIPLTGIIIIEFISLLFYDFLHIPPVIIIVYIILKKKSTINLKCTAYASVILSFWFLTVRLLGFNYSTVSIPLVIIGMVIWPLLNVFFGYILTYKKKES